MAREPVGARTFPSFVVGVVLGLMAAGIARAGFDFGEAGDARGFFETCRIAPDRGPCPCRVTLIESGAPGNVFHPGEATVFTFQLEDLADESIKTQGEVAVVRYGGRGRPGEMWIPEFYPIADVGSVPIHVEVRPKGRQNITVMLPTPETKGGYGLVVDLGIHGRPLLTTYVRTFRPADQRVPYPKQSLEAMPSRILRRPSIQEIPHVKARLDAGAMVKFSFGVNDSTRSPTMDLAMHRSVSKPDSQAFHPDWAEHWANELEFACEK